MILWKKNKALHAYTLACGMLLGITAARAQTDTAGHAGYFFSLNDCINYAMAHQHDVVNAVYNKQYAQEQIRQRTGVLLPHANITGSFQDNLKLTTSLIPDFFSNPPDLSKKLPVQFGTKYTSSISGQVNQTVFNSDYFLGLKAAKVYGALSEKSLTRTEIDTKATVDKAYYNVLVNEENIRLAAANLSQLKKALDDTRARYNAGISERVDVDRIQVSYNTAATQQENLQRMLGYSLDLLKFQMGMPQDSSLQLTQTVKDFSPAALPDTLNYSYQDRIEYSRQLTQIALYQLSLKSTKLGFLPTLSAFANYGFNYFSPKFSELYNKGYGNSAIGLNLSFPVFNGTERIHLVNEAKITLEQSQNDLDNLAQQIRLAVKNAYVQYQNNLALFHTQQTNMQLTQGIYDRIVFKFDQGVSTSLDVISAESELKQAQSDYINALLNTLMSKVDLDQAMGKIK